MKKKAIITLLVLLILSIAWYTYYQYDKENLKIDYYNFQQLWKAKEVVENLDWEQKYYSADSLKSFNYQFDTNIEPLDKRYCYDVYYTYFTKRKDYTFTFWFKLHSKLFKLFNGWEYYNYPYNRKEPTESEQCKKDKKAISNHPWIKWMPPSCVTRGRYYDYMEAVNNPCKK